jgi:hypothetical protein
MFHKIIVISADNNSADSVALVSKHRKEFQIKDGNDPMQRAGCLDGLDDYIIAVERKKKENG